jgi:bifunctional non-homologous end joining protein LigD
MRPASEAAHGPPETVEVEGRRITLTNPDKVLWPSIGFRKRDLLDYYRAVAPVLVPHLAGRPLTMRRFPDGVQGISWFQTECRGRPPWLPAIRLVGPTGRRHDMCAVNDLPSLLWVVNLATVELHPFLGAAPEVDRPAVAVFDLDPGPPAGLIHCCAIALRIRETLRQLRLTAWPKSSGTRGLHLYIPVEAGLSYAETKAFARQVAQRLVEQSPDLVVERSPRALRTGKVFVDWSQNDRMKSTVAPYSLRAAPRPTVSTPVTWAEVEDAVARGDARALVPGPAEALQRLARHGDLMRPVLDRTGSCLTAAHVNALV